MKKRTAFIGAILSLISLGQPLIIKTGAVLSTTGLMLFLPRKVNAEEYTCFIDLAILGREGEYERKTYKRIGTGKNSYFIKTLSSGDKEFFQITKETQEYIVLTETDAPYSYIFVTIIDKNTNEFFEKFLPWKDKSKPRHPLYGECLVSY